MNAKKVEIDFTETRFEVPVTLSIAWAASFRTAEGKGAAIGPEPTEPPAECRAVDRRERKGEAMGAPKRPPAPLPQCRFEQFVHCSVAKGRRGIGKAEPRASGASGV